MTHSDRVKVLHNEYIRAAEKACAVFEPLRVAFETALEECTAIQEQHGPDAPQTAAARERVREAMYAAAGAPDSELQRAFADVDRTRDALRRATLGTEEEGQCQC